MKKFKDKKIYFLGIGGIGVSAIAKYYHHHGAKIFGSDLVSSDVIKDLVENYQASIVIGNNAHNIPQNIDLLIYSPAIQKKYNEEYQKALELSIHCLSYPEALGEISKKYTSIAIAGTNGKTTTTSMLAEAMKNQNINPTVIVGGILQKYQSNFIAGDSQYLILEACEYKRSFLNIHHDIAVITNITEDHLDYFKDLKDIQSAFISFIKNKKESGILICNEKLANLQPIIKEAKKENTTLYDYSQYLKEKYQLKLPGEHNRQNMATALSVMEALQLDVKKACHYLSEHFLGAKRRMEYIGTTKNGALIYDDYAHNPEGIAYLIKGMRKKYPNKKLIVIFEPHLYSRTEDFKEEFGRTLSLADILYLFPVYKDREEEQLKKDFLLKQYISKKENFYLIENPENFIKLFESKKYDNNHIVITVGAGDIWKQGLLLKS